MEKLFVPEAGVEPARVLPHWFLRPARLPIPPLGLLFKNFCGRQRYKKIPFNCFVNFAEKFLFEKGRPRLLPRIIFAP